VTASQSAHPVSRVNECRERLIEGDNSSLQNVEPVEVNDGGELAYIFANGDATYTCQFTDTGVSTISAKHPGTPLSRTSLGHFFAGGEDRGLIFGQVPHGMRRIDYFNETGTWQLASNGTIFYGTVPVPKDFYGVKASAEGVFTAHSVLRQDGSATTRAAQQSACRATQTRTPIAGTELTLLDSREADSRTSVLLLAGAGGLLAVCNVFNGAADMRVDLTVANHPIYDSLLERKDTTTDVHRAVALVQRFPGDAGKGRVVLSNGQMVPLVFINGYAIAWFDRPEVVEADHTEVDMSSGARTVYPSPLRE
jgi:hypothetical protein